MAAEVSVERESAASRKTALAGRKGGWVQKHSSMTSFMTYNMLHIFICSCQILHDKIRPVIQTECPLSEMLETRCVLNFIFFLNVAVFDCTK